MAYDLKPVKVPKLRGLGLRLFTAMVESPIFRPMVLPSLLRNAGVIAFRKRSPQAAPTTYPLVKARETTVPAPQQEGEDAAEAVQCRLRNRISPEEKTSSVRVPDSGMR